MKRITKSKILSAVIWAAQLLAAAEDDKACAHIQIAVDVLLGGQLGGGIYDNRDIVRLAQGCDLLKGNAATHVLSLAGKEEGMLMTTQDGEYKLASFVDEQRMSRLYEKFILEYYTKECPQVKASASQIPWALDDGIGTYLPVMQSDITLTQGSRVLIIDAKYYTHTMQTQFDVHTLHSANLYQIFTYVKNRDKDFGDEPHQVSGMLLYARTDEMIQPDNTYQMSGNQISVKTLDLNQEFSVIAKQLNEIVTEHFPE